MANSIVNLIFYISQTNIQQLLNCKNFIQTYVHVIFGAEKLKKIIN